MFSKKSQNKKSKDLSSGQVVNIIGENTIVEGKVVSKGSIRIDGTVKGDVEVEGKLLLSPTAKVSGDIYCVDAEICGFVEGTIKADGLVAMKETAKIKGDIYYSQIEIIPGAQLESKLVQTKGKSETLPQTEESKAAQAKTKTA